MYTPTILTCTCSCMHTHAGMHTPRHARPHAQFMHAHTLMHVHIYACSHAHTHACVCPRVWVWNEQLGQGAPRPGVSVAGAEVWEGPAWEQGIVPCPRQQVPVRTRDFAAALGWAWDSHGTGTWAEGRTASLPPRPGGCGHLGNSPPPPVQKGPDCALPRQASPAPLGRSCSQAP